MIPAPEALQRLVEGNERFVNGEVSRDINAEHVRRMNLLDLQEPFAIILGCSDSRVPLELVFDQGLGDLFVIRVAGNVVAPTQVGSIEFAAAKFGVRLVVVMGHSGCGAVAATLAELQRPSGMPSGNLGSIIERIKPCLRPMVQEAGDGDAGHLMDRAVKENVRHSVRQLCHGSELIENLIRDEGLRVVGAEYALETGKVDFFDDGG